MYGVGNRFRKLGWLVGASLPDVCCSSKPLASGEPVHMSLVAVCPTVLCMHDSSGLGRRVYAFATFERTTLARIVIYWL